MSFILDALRKSENERQRLSNASIAELPVGRRDRAQPWWVFAIAALLLINLIVLIAVLMRDRFAPKQEASQITPSATTQAAPSIAAAQPIPQNNATDRGGSTSVQSNPPVASSAAPVQNAPVPPLMQEASPPRVAYETVPRAEMELANAGASVPPGPTLVRPITPDAANANTTAAAPDTPTTPAAASPQLKDIRLDLHVYSQNHKESFVLINMHRYTEGQRLLEGPFVEQITPDGVILDYNGSRYQLNRN